MSRYDFPGQAAAAAAYDNASPPEPDDRDSDDALEVIGERLHKSGDLSEVLDDMYQDGDAYVALDRLMCGRAKQFGDERVLQTLLRRLKSLSADVDRELEA